MLDGIQESDLTDLEGDIDHASLSKLAFRYSDGIIQGSPEMDPKVLEAAEASGKPFLSYQSPETYIDAFDDFYNQILEQ